MPTEFHRILDKKLKELSNIKTFIDDVLVVTNGAQKEQWAKVQNVLERLDSMSTRWQLEKCDLSQREANRLGFHFSLTGFKLLNSKVHGKTDALKLKNLKQLRLFLGAVIRMNKLLPNIAQLWFLSGLWQKNWE